MTQSNGENSLGEQEPHRPSRKDTRDLMKQLKEKGITPEQYLQDLRNGEQAK